MLEARANIRSLTSYRPPLAERDGLRLDFNENTAGCSPRVLAALRSLTSSQIAVYPDRAKGERTVAQHLALDPRRVLLTNGVDEAIHLVAEAYLDADDEVIIATPTFAMYEIYARATGAKVIAVAANKSFQFPLDGMLSAITSRTKLIAIANPNNPTGAAAKKSELARLAEAAPDAALLIDEAYFDFYGETMLSELDRFPNLFVARTFSKAYGMAGLRLGLIAGDADKIDMLRRISSPYNVNAAALACLPAALEDQSYVRDYAAQVISGRRELEALLDQLAIPFWPSRANFVLVQLGPLREPFIRAMRDRGILVRDRNTDPGCAGCVRITLGIAAHNLQLFRALREVIDLIR